MEIMCTRKGTAGSNPALSAIFFDSVHDGDIFSVGDGELKFRVSEHGPLSLTARALTEGMLLPRKGVTLINRPLTESGVTPADLSRISEVLKTSARNVSWALSFISSAEDAAQIRSHLPQSSSTSAWLGTGVAVRSSS